VFLDVPLAAKSDEDEGLLDEEVSTNFSSSHVISQGKEFDSDTSDDEENDDAEMSSRTSKAFSPGAGEDDHEQQPKATGRQVQQQKECRVPKEQKDEVEAALLAAEAHTAKLREKLALAKAGRAAGTNDVSEGLPGDNPATSTKRKHTEVEHETVKKKVGKQGLPQGRRVSARLRKK